MKKRLDVLLVEQGLVETRQKAQALILAGQVMVDSQRQDKPGKLIAEDSVLELKNQMKYVSRGGDKLESAHQALGFPVKGLSFLDVGASTGGFTDFLLQNGARQVFAVDVGTNQLAWKLRQDERVVSLEQFHARDLKPEQLPFPIQGIVMDVSFISLRHLIPVVRELADEGHHLIPMFKPQFEVGREHIGRKGVVRDEEVIREALIAFCGFLQGLGYGIENMAFSRIAGPEGNIEFFFHAIHGKLKTFSQENLDLLMCQKRAFHDRG